MVQPDVFVVFNRDIIKRKRIFGAPDLVIEVLSPSTRKKDTVKKLEKYCEAGVREYWTVNPDKERVIIHHFEDEDDYIPKIYTFDDRVPVLIYEGDCLIDFKEIKEGFCFIED